MCPELIEGALPPAHSSIVQPRVWRWKERDHLASMPAYYPAILGGGVKSAEHKQVLPYFCPTWNSDFQAFALHPATCNALPGGFPWMLSQ